MGAITIRALPDTVHDALRAMAATSNVSVEALVRNLLASATGHGPAPVTGFGEASAHWAGAPTTRQDLWGAMRGCIQIPPGADLTAPCGETWKATL